MDGPSRPPASRMTALTLAGDRLPSRPTSLARLKRRASEKKWPEARSWCERRRLNKRYDLREKGKPDQTPARAEIEVLPAQVRGMPSASGVVTRELLVSGFICISLVLYQRAIPGGEGAAIEPNLRGGTADRIRIKYRTAKV